MGCLKRCMETRRQYLAPPANIWQRSSTREFVLREGWRIVYAGKPRCRSAMPLMQQQQRVPHREGSRKHTVARVAALTPPQPRACSHISQPQSTALLISAGAPSANFWRLPCLHQRSPVSVRAASVTLSMPPVILVRSRHSARCRFWGVRLPLHCQPVPSAQSWHHWLATTA